MIETASAAAIAEAGSAPGPASGAAANPGERPGDAGAPRVRTGFFDRRLTRHHPCTVGGHFQPRRVENPAEVEPILNVQERAFGTFHTAWIGPELATRMARNPASISLYVIRTREHRSAPHGRSISAILPWRGCTGAPQFRNIAGAACIPTWCALAPWKPINAAFTTSPLMPARKAVPSWRGSASPASPRHGRQRFHPTRRSERLSAPLRVPNGSRLQIDRDRTVARRAISSKVPVILGNSLRIVLLPMQRAAFKRRYPFTQIVTHTRHVTSRNGVAASASRGTAPYPVGRSVRCCARRRARRCLAGRRAESRIQPSDQTPDRSGWQSRQGSWQTTIPGTLRPQSRSSPARRCGEAERSVSPLIPCPSDPRRALAGPDRYAPIAVRVEARRWGTQLVNPLAAARDVNRVVQNVNMPGHHNVCPAVHQNATDPRRIINPVTSGRVAARRTVVQQGVVKKKQHRSVVPAARVQAPVRSSPPCPLPRHRPFQGVPIRRYGCTVRCLPLRA